MRLVSNSRAVRAAAVVAGLSILAVGCGDDGAAKGKVTGKVVANGQPVTGGSIMFAPVEGLVSEPATGTINTDGTFVLGTAAAGDGAAIGKHFVTFNAPPRTGQEEWDGYGAPPPEKISRYEGLVPKEAEVEVKVGANELIIELIKAPPQSY